MCFDFGLCAAGQISRNNFDVSYGGQDCLWVNRLPLPNEKGLAIDNKINKTALLK